MNEIKFYFLRAFFSDFAIHAQSARGATVSRETANEIESFQDFPRPPPRNLGVCRGGRLFGGIILIVISSL